MAVPATGPLPLPRSWEEYEGIDDARRFEMLDGELLAITPPTILHQWILMHLVLLVGGFVRPNGHGKLYIGPVALRPDPRGDWAEPDLVWVGGDSAAVVGQRWIEGPADLVVEVVSRSLSRRDRVIKKALYARWRIRHYWVVDPLRRALEPYRLDPGTTVYVPARERVVLSDGKERWTAEPFLDDVRVPLDELWAP